VEAGVGARGPAGNPARSEDREEVRDAPPEGRSCSLTTSRTHDDADCASVAICSRVRVSGRASGSPESSGAFLAGKGWGAWRGWWESPLELEACVAGWCLRRRGETVDQWSSFAEAARELWTRRLDRTDRPWAIGWLGYEQCGLLAGIAGLRAPPSGPCDGWWLIEPFRKGGPPRFSTRLLDQAPRLSCSLADKSFRDQVALIREHIAEGQVYQVNLTRRFRAAPWSGGVQPILATTVQGGAPPYLSLFFHSSGELLCASMELLLRRRGDLIETMPIKGTRPRGRDEAEDRRLTADLESDPKELAELAMIVDLERNDLGRVARVGSVRVVDPGSVRSFPAVHHRIARIQAQVDPSAPWWELLAAVAPGGSVTGCPKIAAMELIAAIETTARGPYTGALGVVTASGDVELALPIRCAWSAEGGLEFAAGCGIVWQSDPHREELESRLKVQRWLDLVESRGRRCDDLAQR
jgi:hypothetical protein